MATMTENFGSFKIAKSIKTNKPSAQIGAARRIKSLSLEIRQKLPDSLLCSKSIAIIIKVPVAFYL